MYLVLLYWIGTKQEIDHFEYDSMLGKKDPERPPVILFHSQALLLYVQGKKVPFLHSHRRASKPCADIYSENRSDVKNGQD